MANQHVPFPSEAVPLCVICQRLRPPVRGRWACAAFPDGIPASLLDASGDLGGRPGMTFRRVVLPLALPAVIAGSIFTFALTLGDYIAPQIVSGGQQFIGNVVYTNVGVANNLPLAAAFATVPVVIMIVYLLLARRLGAFEAL